MDENDNGSQYTTYYKKGDQNLNKKVKFSFSYE